MKAAGRVVQPRRKSPADPTHGHAKQRTDAQSRYPVVKTLRQSVKTAQAPGVGFALFVILLICLIALVAGFAFGIFFSAEPTGKGITLKQAEQTLNTEYYECIK